MRQVRWLLAGLGLLAAADAVTSQIAYRQLVGAIDAFLRVAGDESVNGRFVANTLSFSIATSIAVGVSMVVLTAVLIHALRRPSQVARVTGIAAMIMLVLIQIVGISANPNLFADPSIEITGDLEATWDALLPTWFVWTHYAVETAILVAAVAVGVKLSTAKATEYFALRHLVAADDRRLWPGQFADVRMQLRSDPRAVVVPSVAVQAGQQGSFVFVVTDGQDQLTAGTAVKVASVDDRTNDARSSSATSSSGATSASSSGSPSGGGVSVTEHR